MFIEAEQARLAERTRKARDQVSEGSRRLVEQRALVEALERQGRPAGSAKLTLVTLVATQRLAEDYYGRLVKHLNSLSEAATPTE